MRNAALAFAALVLVAALAVNFESVAQHGPPSGPIAAVVDTAAPAGLADGSLWVRSTDLARFMYSDSLGKWLGELTAFEIGNNAASASGFLKFNPNSVTDTTTTQAIGPLCDGVLRLMKVEYNSTTALAACTTYVFGNQTVAVKIVWDGKSDVVTPADSGGQWIADSSRVVFTDGQTISAAQVTGGTLASAPWMRLSLREEVTP